MNSEVTIITSYEEVSKYITAVQSLADKNKDKLGFLPYGVFKEAALRGKLWVAVENSNSVLAGFLLFGGNSMNLKVTQLFVDNGHRGAGIGAKLVKALKSYGEMNQYQTLSARVAVDLPANKFWRKQDFITIEQTEGGKTRNRMINIRTYRIPTQLALDLFDNIPNNNRIQLAKITPMFPIPHYVFDLNILFDIAKKRANCTIVEKIIGASISSDFRLSVTPELTNELSRTSLPNSSDVVLGFAKSIPVLPVVDSQTLDPIIWKVVKNVFPEYNSDHKNSTNKLSDCSHIAYCVHHDAAGFITRDEALLRNGEKIKSIFGVEVLSPFEFLQAYNLESLEIGFGQSIETTEAKIAEMLESDRENIQSFLELLQIDRNSISTCLDSGTGLRSKKRIVAKEKNRIVGYCSWEPTYDQSQIINVNLFISEHTNVLFSVLDVFLEKLQRNTHKNKLTRLIIQLNPSAQKVKETMIKRYYFESPNNSRSNVLEGLAFNGVLHESIWGDFAEMLYSQIMYKINSHFPTSSELTNSGLLIRRTDNTNPIEVSLFDFETIISPGFILSKDRNAILVPIQEQFASDLLDLNGQTTFLPKPSAALKLEKAYFLSPNKHMLFEKGAIIVFYVSGGKQNIGRKAAIACARIVYSDTIHVDEAFSKLGRQGVLPKKELKLISRNDLLTVFTFDNFLPLKNEVSFRRLKELKCVNGANLITSQKLTNEQFCKILEEGGMI